MPLKGQNLELENFRSILPFTFEVQRQNAPNSSWEPNESDIVNRQIEGEKLKYYVVKFYIKVHNHVILRMCNDDSPLCVYESIKPC